MSKDLYKLTKVNAFFCYSKLLTGGLKKKKHKKQNMQMGKLYQLATIFKWNLFTFYPVWIGAF